MFRNYFNLYAAAVLFGGSLAVSASPALAQTATSATYDSWTARCSTRTDQGKSVKGCEIISSVMVQLQNGQTGVAAVMALGRSEAGKPLKLVVQVPVMSWIPNGVKLQDKDGKEIAKLDYTFCRNDLCEASVDFTDAQAQALKKQGDSVFALYRNAGQQDVRVEVSLKGYAGALDALTKELPAGK